MDQQLRRCGISKWLQSEMAHQTARQTARWVNVRTRLNKLTQNCATAWPHHGRSWDKQAFTCVVSNQYRNRSESRARHKMLLHFCWLRMTACPPPGDLLSTSLTHSASCVPHYVGPSDHRVVSLPPGPGERPPVTRYALGRTLAARERAASRSYSILKHAKTRSCGANLGWPL